MFNFSLTISYFDQIISYSSNQIPNTCTITWPPNKLIISNSNLRTVTKYIYIKYTKINFPRIFCYPRNISFQLFRLSPCLNYSSNRCVQNRVIRIYNEKYISQSHYPQDSSPPNHISTTRNHSSVQSEPTQ